MSLPIKIYGFVFCGGTSLMFFWLAVDFWSDNIAFALFLGFFGLAFGLLTIGLFLIPIIRRHK